MSCTRRKPAFTLIELLVVVAIIALLISILLPSLQGAREQGKKAVCLSNMRQIAQASHSYANDDDREQIVPLHRMMVSTLVGGGFGGTEWSWRTATPFCFGGRTAQKIFPTESGPVSVLTQDWGLWGAPTKPLNKYIYGDIDAADFDKLPMFKCPSDAGFPDSVWVQDAPQECADIPLYDMLGNSYRINVAGLVWLAGSLRIGSFTVSAWGHTASSIDNPSRVAMYSEPLFYNFSRQGGLIDNPEVIPIPGWHKKIMSDLVAYCDGSARMTRVDKQSEFDAETLRLMNYTTAFPAYYFLRRGKTWQTDCYPSPGALIKVFAPNGTDMTPDINYVGWPFNNYQTNLTPN
ncbi:MAG: prepilin-type N-terminal cleavage/methylation domain-containing protein [Planctomycetota bacterium]